MLYAILCYDSEEAITAWTKAQDEEAMTKLSAVQDRWEKEGRLGPVARLASTRSAQTLRKGRSTVVMDGPFAETKEQLLGFFVVDCASVDEAVEAAKELGVASSSNGAYEIRPLSFFRPGVQK
jgi:hypothetical protein